MTPQYSSVLLSNLYALTMLEAYFEEGMRAPSSICSCGVYPSEGTTSACGLDNFLAFLETLRFDQAALAYLDSLGRFSGRFLQFLEQLRFTGDVL